MVIHNEQALCVENPLFSLLCCSSAVVVEIKSVLCLFPSTHKWDVLLVCVYCAAPQRPNGPHTLAPHSPGEFPSRFRVSSPSGRDDKTLSLSSSGFFCLVVRIQTKQRKSTFGNELELGGGGLRIQKGFSTLSPRGRRDEDDARKSRRTQTKFPSTRGTRKGRAPG